MLTIQELSWLILFTWFAGGWCIGSFGARSANPDAWWWKAAPFALLITMTLVGLISLVPADIRWQAEPTPEHNHAMVLMFVGFALAVTGGIWGTGFTRWRLGLTSGDLKTTDTEEMGEV